MAPLPARGQGQAAVVPDTLIVEGNRRVTRETVLLTAGLAPRRLLSYREAQQSVRALFGSGQYDDVQIEQRNVGGRVAVAIVVRERPLLVRWNVRGVEQISDRSVRDVSQLAEGRPVDYGTVEKSRAAIDSLYRARGFALASVTVARRYEVDSTRVTVVFEVHEGRRVAIGRVQIEGNTHFSDEEIVGAMHSRPEGFWWFRPGKYDSPELQRDLSERLPHFFGERGHADFQVLGDTLVVDERTGKATVIVRVSEGEPYRVGTFEIAGNRRFSTEELQVLYPFEGPLRTGALGLSRATGPRVFNQALWDEATRGAQLMYFNNGYIYVRLDPQMVRRTDDAGHPIADLRWVIEEGRPAVVNRVDIVGNQVTRERVIRDAITLLPGDVFRQDALVRSYQNVSNLGFFEQPIPTPETRPANEEGDVDVIFTVTEKRTGNVNFGASVGQGTGLGGFIGLEEPNLFGQGKRGKFQWQFGKNINDFDLSYTDPAIQDSRLSGTLSVHNTRLRYSIGDLGQLRRRGGSIQIGFPAFRDRYTRLFVSYSIDGQTFSGAQNEQFGNRFGCSRCVRSTLGASMMRDTRIDLPFPTGGAMVQVNVSQSGGPLGGRGNFQRVDLEGRWYAPLGELGGDTRRAGVRFALALTTRSGFVFGADAPFFDQLFAMGGTQFGIPLRGYNEFAITPLGFDANAQTGQASGVNSFGKAFFATTAELGARLSQIFYIGLFYDAGNLWGQAGEYNPTRLFRGAGIGLAMVSPLGPIGVDYAYGFDRIDLQGRPDPGWKLHFKIGNVF